MSDATSGASIYYTVTGVSPTTMSTKYTGPVTVSKSMTLQAIAAVSGGTASAITSAAYTILPSATPSFSVPGGAYQVFKSVTLSDATSGASIYYTVTGVTPTTMSTLYTGPIAVNSNMTLQAIAAVPGGPVSPVAAATYSFVPAVAPALSVAAGSYQSPQTVTLSDATSGAAIYYTVTGVTPTVLSTKYTGPITVNSSMTLSVIAAIPGGPVSPVASAAYTILPAATPAFSIGTGSYTVFKSVTMTDATPGASIYYTVTGVTPTTMSTLYTGPVAVNSSMTLKAIAALPGGPISAVEAATYTFVPPVAPTLSVAPGSYSSPQSVTISDSTPNTTIFYTVSGATPTVSSTKYAGPVTVGSNMTLSAIAVVIGGPPSAVASAVYSIAPAGTPTFSVPGGTYQAYQSVTISDASSGTSIYYTVTGVTPTTMSTLYTGPVSVNRNMTLKAIAAFSSGGVSPVATATYTFVPAVAPTLSVAAGSYLSPQTVTIGDATSGAAIYYTVTGVTPTVYSTKYTGPITVSSNMTLSAIAAVPGGPAGPVTSAAYTILPAAAPAISESTGTYQGIQSVTMSDSTPGASIYYTVTGVTPTTLSSPYAGPIAVTGSMTLQAIAAVPGGPVSPIASAAYTIVPHSTPVETPNSTATFFGMSIDYLTNGTPWPDLPVATIRLWDTSTKWGDLDPTSGTYQWQNLDQQVSEARANNSQVLYTFGGVPPWALPTNVPVASISRSNGVVTVTTTSPHGLYYDPTQAATSEEMFTVTGVSNSGFNGNFYLTGTPSATTLTYAQAGTNGSSSSGTVSAVCGGEYAPALCAQAPASLTQWDAFVTQLISHLGPGAVQAWEIWNEASDPLYWQGDPQMLVSMAQDARSIIKAVDPAAVFVSPSITGVYETQAECLGSVPYCGTTWLNNWLALGGRNSIDAVALHGYPTSSDLAPEEIQGSAYQLLAAMSQNGVGSMPIWDTESSWRNNTNIPAQADQAGWLARHFLLEQSIGIQRTFWYAYDTPQWGTLWTSTSGLDPAGEAYGQVAKWLTGATVTQPCAAVPTDQTTFVCDYSRPDGYVAQAVWSTTGATSYAVSSQFVQYHDDAGNVWPVSGGTVQISTTPILLESSSAF